MTHKPILLAEDEEHDVLFMRMAMKQAGVIHPLAVVKNGQEAIEYLSGCGPFADRQQYPIPRLVLLDLKLPLVPGLDVLRWIRSQLAYVELPVIICSSSDQDSDVENAYLLGATAYIVKSALRKERTEKVRLIKRYWLDSNGPPRDCAEWLSAIIPPPA